MVHLGETERAERAIAELGEQERERGQIRIAKAVLRLAQDHSQAAINALAPVLDGSAPVTRSTWLAQACHPHPATRPEAHSTLGGYLLSLWIGLFGFTEVRTTPLGSTQERAHSSNSRRRRLADRIPSINFLPNEVC